MFAEEMLDDFVARNGCLVCSLEFYAVEVGLDPAQAAAAAAQFSHDLHESCVNHSPLATVLAGIEGTMDAMSMDLGFDAEDWSDHLDDDVVDVVVGRGFLMWFEQIGLVHKVVW